MNDGATNKNKKPKKSILSTIIIMALAIVVASSVMFYVIILQNEGSQQTKPIPQKTTPIPTESPESDKLEKLIAKREQQTKLHMLHMPDLSGYSADKAVILLNQIGISASLENYDEIKLGSTTIAPQLYIVVDQVPKPGTQFRHGTAVTLLIAQSSTFTDTKIFIPPDSKQDVDDLLEKMDWGNIIFNSPPKMELYDVAIIDLMLDLDKPMEALQTKLKEKMDTHIPMQMQQNRVRVIDRMEARLTGTDFEITAVTPELQAISRNETTIWKWQIKPISSGAHYLHLTLTAILTIDGKDIERAIRTFDERIEVNVSWSSKISNFLSNNWKWLWAVIFVPLFGWLWKRWKNKKE